MGTLSVIYTPLPSHLRVTFFYLSFGGLQKVHRGTVKCTLDNYLCHFADLSKKTVVVETT